MPSQGGESVEPTFTFTDLDGKSVSEAIVILKQRIQFLVDNCKPGAIIVADELFEFFTIMPVKHET